MDKTLSLFEERKAEVDFYFTVLIEVLKPDTSIITLDNHRFGRMLKSNFLLMLYNLIESCVKQGFEEIYSAIESRGLPYKQVSETLRDIWSGYEISLAIHDDSTQNTYAQRVKKIIKQVISETPLIIAKGAMNVSGNLDAKQIRNLLKKHQITFVETNAGEKHHILSVKNKRNSLTHGDESFDEAGRDFTTDDLKKFKDEVFIFINDVLNAMKIYYDQQLFMINS